MLTLLDLLAIGVDLGFCLCPNWGGRLLTEGASLPRPEQSGAWEVDALNLFRGAAVVPPFTGCCRLLSESCLKGRACNASHLGLLARLFSFRFGEASNPGPGRSRGSDCAEDTFVLGAFNPTGLNGKHGVVATLPPGIYSVSESHLTLRGLGAFRDGLRFAKAPFRFAPGPPAPPRARSPVTGDYTGVGFLTSFPCRAAPCDFPPALRATARVQVSSFLVGAVWLLGAVLYGMPVAPLATEQLLQAVTTRVVLQGEGPRFIAGDFNLEPHSNRFAPLWAQHGFVDVQDLWHRATGVVPKVTCKASTRKDFVFVSPELHGLLKEVVIDETWFCDHALVQATFKTEGLKQVVPVWRVPKARPLPPAVARPLSGFPAGDTPSDPTEAYLWLWQAHESNVDVALKACGQPPLRRSERGRAATLDTGLHTRVAHLVPPGREGEVQPGFVGSDKCYVLWFRQLRRLQALWQSLARNTATDAAQVYRAGLWHSIRTAAGFRPSFAEYWPHRAVQKDADPPRVPLHLPCPSLAEGLFRTFQANVQQMERELTRTRQKQAAARRVEHPMLIFRDLRAARSQPVESIVDSLSVDVAEVQPEDGAVVLTRPIQWNPSGGFYLNQSPVEVHHVEPDMLWGAFTSAKPGDKVTQMRIVADLPSLFRAFGQHWSRFWMRHESIDAARWAQLTEVEPATAVPAYTCVPLTVCDWYAEVRAKHAHTATGPDGVSRQDLMALSPALTEELVALCRGAEATGRWPRQLLNATVTAVEKTEEAEAVGHFRPICVLPLPYRVWSSLRARAALKHLAAIAPADLHGNLPGRTAGAVWFQLQLELEEAAIWDETVAGAFLDLSKAFNTLPRTPVFALALHYGIPAEVVKAWSGAVTMLSRRFRIRGSVGPALPSFTGFPEGDALSCVAMALVDLALHRHLNGPSTRGLLETFVDDWQVKANSATRVLAAVARVEAFAQAWDLALDPGKMVLWASSAAERRHFRQQGRQVVHAARNLGGHQAFTRARTNDTIKQRLLTLDLLWPRLRSSLAPLNQKFRALVAAAWPKALHGISSTNLGATNFEQLRSGAIRGLGIGRPGMNPVLVLSLVEFPLCDPEFYALCASFRDVRAFAAPERLSALLAELLAGDRRWAPGPAQVFLERCHAVGMAWLPAQQSLEDSISVFDPWAVSPQELQLRLTFAWQRRVCSDLEDRPGFAGLSQVDPQLTRSLKKGWEPTDRLHALHSHSGVFYTQDALRHFGDGEPETSACKYCGARDSVRHRVWHCPAFADQRASLDRGGLPDAGALPDAQSLHAWALRPKCQVALWRSLAELPDYSDAFQRSDVLEPVLQLFTDGSCLLPRIPQLRLAAWAVMYASLDGRTPVLLASGPLPGLVQTAFRAEAMAVLSALTLAVQLQQPVTIWCDCSGVVRKVGRMLRGDFSWRPSMANADIWKRILALLDRVPCGTQICKVMAHVEEQDTSSVLEEWALAGNSAVDKAAEAANLARPAWFWELWNEVRRDYALQSMRGKMVLEMHRDIARAAVRRSPAPAVGGPDPPEGPTLAVPAWPGPVPAHLLRFGGDYALRLHEWLRKLAQEPARPQWYSCAQLYIAFVFDTSVIPPVYDSKARSWRSYAPGDIQLHCCSFSERVRMFRQHIKALLHAVGGMMGVQEVRPCSSALAIKMSSCYVPLCPNLYRRVESWLALQFDGGACVQNGREWACLAFPPGA